MASLRDGVQLDDPLITVPWGLSKPRLVRFLEPHGLRRLFRSNQYSLPCTAFGGLAVEMWIRYDVNFGQKKYSIGFCQRSPTNLNADYARFEHQLIAAFGLPMRTEPGSLGRPPTQFWTVDDFVVSHYVHAQDESRDAVMIAPAKPGLLGRILEFASWLVNAYFKIPFYWFLIIVALAAIASWLRR